MSKQNAISPSFARIAAEYLHDGDVQRALEICLSGIKKFPEYATGHFILGKCYQAFGRNTDALEQYRKALTKIPDSTTLRDLVRDIESMQQKEFRESLEEQDKRYERRTPPSPPPQQPPPLEVKQTEVRSAEPEKRDEESTVEYLSKRLQNVKRIHPTHESEQTPLPNGQNVSFVTSTMAEILAGQGNYEAAIMAYKSLLEHHPEEKHLRRLEELQRLNEARKKERRSERL